MKEIELQTMPLRFRVWDRVGQQFLKRRLPEGVSIEFSIFELPLETDCLDENEKLQFVISQDTGLKDKNGKSIFTGDIVEIDQWEETDTYSEEPDIVHPAKRFVAEYYPNRYESMVPGGWTSNFLTIIGNIWQNPELLEGLDES